MALGAIPEGKWTMSEVEREVSTFKVDYRCDHCPDGVMRPTGIVYPMVEPAYPHYCTACGHTATFPHRYPRIVTRTKEADPAPTGAIKAKELPAILRSKDPSPNAIEAKEQLDQECRVTDEMLQRRVTL
jgi:hypothetical protein